MTIFRSDHSCAKEGAQTNGEAMKRKVDWNKVTTVIITALTVLFNLLVYVLIGLLFIIKHAGKT